MRIRDDSVYMLILTTWIVCVYCMEMKPTLASRSVYWFGDAMEINLCRHNGCVVICWCPNLNSSGDNKWRTLLARGQCIIVRMMYLQPTSTWIRTLYTTVSQCCIVWSSHDIIYIAMPLVWQHYMRLHEIILQGWLTDIDIIINSMLTLMFQWN